MHMLNHFEETQAWTYILYHPFTLKWHLWLQSILMEDDDLSILHIFCIKPSMLMLIGTKTAGYDPR